MTDILAGTNLEIKARSPDLDAARERVRAMGARRQGVERQEDAYFRVPEGRLKLRRSSRDGAHLIAYLRPDGPRPSESRFHRLPVADPDGLEATLGTMLGHGPRVAKSREVWWWKDVRIHLDEVDEVGRFVELEARVDAIGDPDVAADRIERLIDALGIETRDLIDGSYAEVT